jgi:hypothetical protein
MSQETTYAGMRGEWQGLLAPLVAKPPGLEHLEAFQTRLGTVLDRSLEITKQQAALAAEKQKISKELQSLMVDGERLAALIRKALKQQFGPKAEELTAFKLQPFRGRKAAKPAPDGGGSTPPPVVPPANHPSA